MKFEGNFEYRSDMYTSTLSEEHRNYREVRILTRISYFYEISLEFIEIRINRTYLIRGHFHTRSSTKKFTR